MIVRTYSELITLKTFEERVAYLATNSRIGESTFGHSRYLDQDFYLSHEWRDIKNYVITRDLGCDLALLDRPINDTVTLPDGRVIIVKDMIHVHHMNPLSVEDLVNHSDFLLNPEYLVTASHDTHNLIHFGDISKRETLSDRRPNDTSPWRK